ncbi:MAG TPA: hypothetical protein VJK48_02820 [Chlamydiales bacterium]|nr:hypothetical protein [Chlamydiales bacterium]
MFQRCFLLSLVSLFAQSPDSLLIPIAPAAPPVLFEINPAERGADILSVFQRLQSAPYADKNTFEISLVTVTNGHKNFIPFVNNIVPVTPPPKNANIANYNTLVIVWHRLVPGGDVSKNKYLIFPVEQIVQLVYSQQTIDGSSVQQPVPSQGTIPYYTVDPVQRAYDIQSAVFSMNNLQPYKNTGPTPNVSITTTLRGTYNGQALENGVIPFVRAVQPYGSMMIVTYQFTQSNNIPQYIVVNSEQVISINYLRNVSR